MFRTLTVAISTPLWVERGMATVEHAAMLILVAIVGNALLDTFLPVINIF